MKRFLVNKYQFRFFQKKKESGNMTVSTKRETKKLFFNILDNLKKGSRRSET